MRTNFKGCERQLCKPKDLQNLGPVSILERARIGTSLPVDMDAVLRSLKIVAAPTSFKSLEMTKGNDFRKLGNIMGMVGIRKDNVVMVYAHNLDYSQIRYTVAHELGHACLHTNVLSKGHVLARYSGTLDTDKENAANAFASELLLPKDGVNTLFIECLDVFGLTNATEKEQCDNRRRIFAYIADKSQVPYDVVEDRLVQLKPYLCHCIEEAVGVE